jgi:hypothetical protein
LNNLIWLAYAQKVGDDNIGIPSIIGKCSLAIAEMEFFFFRHSLRRLPHIGVPLGQKFAKLNRRLFCSRFGFRDFL